MIRYQGKVAVFRVHQGTVTKDTQLYIGSGRKSFKVGHLFMLQGGKYVEIGNINQKLKVEIDPSVLVHGGRYYAYYHASKSAERRSGSMSFS